MHIQHRHIYPTPHSTTITTKLYSQNFGVSYGFPIDYLGGITVMDPVIIK